MEPAADVVWHALAADMADEAQEGLLDEVVGGVVVADGRHRERLDVLGVRVEGRLDELGDAGGRARDRARGDVSRDHGGVGGLDIWCIDVRAADVLHWASLEPADAPAPALAG